jgi:hypothetical protein
MKVSSILAAALLLPLSPAALADGMDDLIAYVEDYRNAYPEKSWEEIDHDLFFSIQSRSENADDYDYASIIDALNASDIEFIKGRLKLTDAERSLFNASPSRGVMAIRYGYTASLATEDNWTSGFHNGNADAFRHCYWNALMTINIERSWTHSWTKAHEEYPGNPPLEKLMDLRNNLNGQQIGMAYQTNDRSKSGCLAATQVGRLTRIVAGEHKPSNNDGRKL